jgi:hypothetical protein
MPLRLSDKGEERIAVRTKLLAMGLTFCFLASLILLMASPALAAEEGTGEGDLGPSPENGEFVAVGGVIGVYAFLAIILLLVLRKRKKQQLQM